MVRAERTIGYEIVLDVPDGSPRSQGSSGSSFSVRLEIVLITTQDRCAVCTERTLGSEIVLDALMELLGDTGHLESRFGPFGDGVCVGARQVHGLRQTYHRLRNRFGRTRWHS